MTVLRDVSIRLGRTAEWEKIAVDCCIRAVKRRNIMTLLQPAEKQGKELLVLAVYVPTSVSANMCFRVDVAGKCYTYKWC